AVEVRSQPVRVDRAALPEGLDELVLLVGVADLEEGLPLLVGDDHVYELQPVPVFLLQPRRELLDLLARELALDGSRSGRLRRGLCGRCRLAGRALDRQLPGARSLGGGPFFLGPLEAFCRDLRRREELRGLDHRPGAASLPGPDLLVGLIHLTAVVAEAAAIAGARLDRRAILVEVVEALPAGVGKKEVRLPVENGPELPRTGTVGTVEEESERGPSVGAEIVVGPDLEVAEGLFSGAARGENRRRLAVADDHPPGVGL